MAADQDNMSKILASLAHPLRRQILLYLNDKGECSFTDLMIALNVDTGKLSFHIRSLADFLDQTLVGKYVLSRVGENAIRLIRDVETWAVEVGFARSNSVLPLASLRKRALAFLLDFGIALALFVALPAGLSSLAFRPFFFDFNVIIYFLILLWIYLTLLEGFSGQTLGKRLLGLRVIRIDSKRLFYDHAAVRNFGKVFLLPVDLLIGLKLKDRRFRRYFDKFSGTTVIDSRP